MVTFNSVYHKTILMVKLSKYNFSSKLSRKEAKWQLNVVPGQIELHLMLSPTKSAAIPLLRPITAALVDPYTHRLGAPVTGIHTFYRKICYIWLPVLEKNLNMSSCLNCGILNAFCCYNGKSKNKSKKYVRERQREGEGG